MKNINKIRSVIMAGGEHVKVNLRDVVDQSCPVQMDYVSRHVSGWSEWLKDPIQQEIDWIVRKGSPKNGSPDLLKQWSSLLSGEVKEGLFRAFSECERRRLSSMSIMPTEIKGKVISFLSRLVQHPKVEFGICFNNKDFPLLMMTPMGAEYVAGRAGETWKFQKDFEVHDGILVRGDINYPALYTTQKMRTHYERKQRRENASQK